MKFSFRWYGKDNDAIPLKYIKQIPNTDEVVWALHHKQAGEVWSEEEINNEVKYIESFGLKASVVESVNIHDDIKLGLPSRETYIENYKQTLINLAKANVKVVCYNFMPVFDWTRTELFHPLEDGSTALFFEKERIMSLTPQELIELFNDNSKDFTLPGWEPERMSKIKELFEKYEGITYEKLLENFKYFIDSIIPVCEKYDIKMAIHPDDPPFEIFGLPRLVNNEENIQRLLDVNTSPYNGLTFCTGSLGVNKMNNLEKLLEKFIDRVHFMHIRNVRMSENGDFLEVSHLSSDGNVRVHNIIRILFENNFKGFVRPDHGRHVFGENQSNTRPGYGLYDRAMGIMYFNGCLDILKSEQ